ncbi:MAG: insulinase family protein, partial [Planctomycetes bacterium]|nr:insulinase family protein [Planctomycetota bacterium]
AASPELIRAYYDAWYRPERMILAVVGAIDLDVMAQAVESRLGPLRSRATAVDPGMGTLAPAELDVLWHHDQESPSTALTLVRVRAEPNPHDSPRWRRQRLIESMAAQVLSRRLSEIAEGDPEGPLISGDADIGRWLDLVYASVGGDVRPGRGEAAVAVVELALRRFVEHGPTEAELAVARANALSGLERAVDQQDTRTNAALAAELYDSVHEDQVFLSPEQARALLAPLLSAITADDLRTAFAAASGSGHRALLISGREPRPADADARLRAAFALSGATAVAAPDPVADLIWAYGERPVAGKVVAERAATFDIVQLECANCVRINLLRTDYKPGEVLAQVRIELPAGEPTQAGLRELAQLGYLRGGLGLHSRQELRTVLAGTTARVAGVEWSEDALIFPASCVPKDLERLLQQLRAWVIDPAWRPEAEAQAKSAWLDQLSSLATDLEEQVERRFTSVAVGDDPARRPATAEEAAAARFAAVRAWLDPYLRDAPLTLTIVGDIDLASTRELAVAYAGSLPVRRKGRVVVDPTVAGALARAPAMPAGEHRLDIPGTVPRAVISVAWPTDDYYDIAVTRRLGVLAQAMSERLRERLREELGQAYSPHVGRFASEAFDGFGYLRAEAAVAPEHADAARALILAVAARLRDEGVDADLLDQVKPPLVKNLAAQRQQNGYWLNAVAARSQEQPVRLEWSRGMEQDFAAIDAAGLSALARRYLAPERALIVIGVCTGAAAPVDRP